MRVWIAACICVYRQPEWLSSNTQALQIETEDELNEGASPSLPFVTSNHPAGEYKTAIMYIQQRCDVFRVRWGWLQANACSRKNICSAGGMCLVCVCLFCCMRFSCICIHLHVGLYRCLCVTERVSGRIAVVYHCHAGAAALSSDVKGQINSMAACSHVEDPLLQETLHCRLLREWLPVRVRA